MSSPRLLLYARTLPTLRPSQVVGRLLRQVRRTRPDPAPAPPRRRAGNPVPGVRKEIHLESPDHFRALGRSCDLSAPGAWRAPGQERLFLYHLHYFDDLHGAGADRRALWHRRLIGRWIDANAPAEGPGWEPYPLSRRIVNWVRWDLGGHPLDERAEHSLAVQARYLSQNLETHLLGNHLMANAVALVAAGLFFGGGEGDGWLAQGLRLLEAELGEQLLADGGHFERSPMYHALVLSDLLDVLGLLRAQHGTGGERSRRMLQNLPRRIAAMRRWLAAMVHPDGEIPFFNDAAFGMAPAPAELDRYARRLGLGAAEEPRAGLTQLAESGYLRMHAGGAVLIADVGEVGPRYLPGHAHADTLSFELSVDGRRVVVNSGTSLYERGPERLRQRSTAAHSTVLVNGEDSSEVWDSFRVARRAVPHELECGEDQRGVWARCSHDGYRRLTGRPEATRRWQLSDRGLVVHDRVTGEFRTAEARYHLHPDVHITRDGTAGGSLELGDARQMAWTAEGAAPTAGPSTWHPRFHESVPNTCLRLRFEGAEAQLALQFEER